MEILVRRLDNMNNGEKEITVYELLGLMKDRKAPKKIECLGCIMVFVETGERGDYESTEIESIKLSNFKIIDCLNDKVEILE